MVGKGNEMLWGGRMVCGCEVECEVLSEHGVAGSEQRDKQGATGVSSQAYKKKDFARPVGQ